jgi:hypothetical protein
MERRLPPRQGTTGRSCGRTRREKRLIGPLRADTDYCTFAVRDAVAFRVNVQVFALFPPLEHAPDQMASRPLLTDSVTDVPALNVADPLEPTDTLMPVGLDVTRSPLRPLALTVNVTVPVPPPPPAAGLTVSVLVRVTPP